MGFRSRGRPPGYGARLPARPEFALRFGRRTILAVPLLRDSRALGTILLRRPVIEHFSDKQIALLGLGR